MYPIGHIRPCASQAKDIKAAIAMAKSLQERVVMPKAKAKRSAKTKTVPYDIAEQLRTPEEMAAYLDAWFEEAPRRCGRHRSRAGGHCQGTGHDTGSA